MFPYKIWSSAADGCSCSLCMKLEGTALPAGEPFVIAGRSVQAPPLHEGCRCALAYEDRLAPAPTRDLDAYCRFASIAKSSDDFFAAVNSYHAAVFFLRRLAGRSTAELESAGLSSSHLCSAELSSLVANQDDFVNEAILRAYNRVVVDASCLKTERGRRARVDQFVQLILSSQLLSPVNYQYLRSVFDGVTV